MSQSYYIVYSFIFYLRALLIYLTMESSSDIIIELLIGNYAEGSGRCLI
jgi:hypothetical protein